MVGVIVHLKDNEKSFVRVSFKDNILTQTK